MHEAVFYFFAPAGLYVSVERVYDQLLFLVASESINQQNDVEWRLSSCLPPQPHTTLTLQQPIKVNQPAHKF
jgi:hypothetical protein